MIAIVLITHGYFGRELLQTAQDIVGRQEAASALSVTADTGIAQLSQAIDKVHQQFSGASGVLFLVDMLGGTPCNTSVLKSKEKNAEVVTGVNLYMVLSAFRHRDTLDLKTLAAKAAEDGRRAIVLPKDMLKKAP